jgi:hypothetical protein
MGRWQNKLGQSKVAHVMLFLKGKCAMLKGNYLNQFTGPA